jgi:hypothetical protein
MLGIALISEAREVLAMDAPYERDVTNGSRVVWKDAKMLSFETASKATDLSNLLFIGGLLTIVVFGALGAYVASKRPR